MKGLEGLREWPFTGDPFRIEFPFTLPKSCFGRDKPNPEIDGLFADCGLRS